MCVSPRKGTVQPQTFALLVCLLVFPVVVLRNIKQCSRRNMYARLPMCVCV